MVTKINTHALQNLFSNYDYLKKTALPQQIDVSDSLICSVITKLFPIYQFSAPAHVPVKKTAKNIPPCSDPPKCTQLKTSTEPPLVN
jgi:hypothetical protein